ncbi:cell division protein FtsL [Stenoxybacter acetivorans]|uniref:cell division protein FtsL n=1 Tax=Stenoxybacter acetivorans TaxID=422441 RepID=UPI000567F3D8|nr:cell division protein FtsL [Stenoxybacter acetivorans]
MGKLNLALYVLTLVSGFAMVHMRSDLSQAYVQLLKEQRKEVLLNEDFNRLKLAQAQLSESHLIQANAAKQQLHLPGLGETRIIDAVLGR